MNKLHIFIINLKDLTERRAIMQRQFENLSEDIKQRFSISFFNAIDARKGEHLAFKQYSKIASILFRGKELSDGERGCFASHYSLWEECIRLNSPIVVLEDDMQILPNFWEEISRIAKSEYAYVRLMFLEHRVKATPLPNNFYISFDKLTGTQGYYLTPIAAKAFRNKASIWYRPIDDYMGMFYIHKIPSICVKPVICEIEIDTSIKGRWSKVKGYLKIIREISRLMFQTKRAIFLLTSKKSLIMPKYALDSLIGGGQIVLEREIYSLSMKDISIKDANK